MPPSSTARAIGWTGFHRFAPWATNMASALRTSDAEDEYELWKQNNRENFCVLIEKQYSDEGSLSYVKVFKEDTHDATELNTQINYEAIKTE